MLEPCLFLGIEIDEPLRKALLYVNPKKIDLFINGDAAYLQEVEHEGKRFIGKRCGQHQLIEALELTKNNVTSLIAKLLPEYEERPFVLFAGATAVS